MQPIFSTIDAMVAAWTEAKGKLASILKGSTHKVIFEFKGKASPEGPLEETVNRIVGMFEGLKAKVKVLPSLIHNQGR